MGNTHSYSQLVKMGEDEFTRVPVKFIDDLSQKIEHLQQSLRRKQRILNKVLYLTISKNKEIRIRNKSLKMNFQEQGSVPD